MSNCLYNCRLCTITIYIKLFPTRLDFSYFSFMYIFGCWLNAVTMVHSYAISCPINQWRRWAWRQQKTMNKLHLWKVLNNANTAADNRTYKKDYLCQKRKEFHKPLVLRNRHQKVALSLKAFCFTLLKSLPWKFPLLGPVKWREGKWHGKRGRKEDKEIARQDSTRTRTRIQQRKIKKLVIYRNCNIAQGASFHYLKLLGTRFFSEKEGNAGSKQ